MRAIPQPDGPAVAIRENFSNLFSDLSDDRTLGRSNTYRVTFEVLRMLQVAFGTPVSPDYGHQSSALVDIHGWDGPFFIWNLAP
jgi:hypothetical protein